MAATAAGAGVLSVTIEPVDYTTGAPQPTAAFGTFGDGVGYKVSYSCAVASCDGATVQLAPAQPDPYGLASQYVNVSTLAKTLLYYSTWTAPFAGATIGGTDTTGKLINLGNLAAGTSGTFVVTYLTESGGTYSTARAAQFYPDGFQLQNSATISSPTATAPVTHAAAPVTWNIQVPTPGITKYNPGTVKPDVNVTYTIAMGSGSFPRRDSSAITGTSQWQAAGSYVVVDQLPAQAVYVSSSGAGVYDPITHTVTWTSGTLADPAYRAAGGWGFPGTSGWVARDGYGPRTVTVKYPAANFTTVNGCEFDESVTNNVTTSLTYLDTARTVKSTSSAATHDVSCHTPFGRAVIGKDTTRSANTGATRLLNVPPDVTGLTCPPSGSDAWGRACTPGVALAAFADSAFYWTVTAYNQGNVPGIATVTDTALDQADAPVYRVQAATTTPAASIAWTYQCASSAPVSGTTATNVALTTAQINAGCRYTSAVVTSGSIAAGNIKPEGTGNTPFTVNYYYTVKKTAPIGEQRTNIASATMAYPDYSIPTVNAGSASAKIQFRATPTSATKPSINAGFVAPAVVAGGGNAVPGSNVTFTVRGSTANIPDDVDITPQYVFVAPVGWHITPGSASFATGEVPAGVTFSYETKTIGGVSREVAVATWPNTVTFGKDVAWPTMSVVAKPTYAVAAGTASVAAAWMGDSRHTWDNTEAIWGGSVEDTPDVDSDGITTERFATATQNVSVFGVDGVTVTKEICLPDESASDGCDWIGDPSQTVPVSTVATDIKYRVTIQNTGNSVLGNVVAYDVLPWIGDSGTMDSTANTPRGSTFEETLDSVSGLSSNVTLQYSTSKNPPRPEVYTGTTSGTWGPTVSGAQSIKATVAGTLAPGATASFTYEADVVAGAAADAIACNSIAVDTDKTLPSEPPAVCASSSEADLRLTVPSRLPLQVGRPGVIPFTVTNLGGSAQAPAEVTVDIPAGLTVTSLTPAGWSCAATPAQTAPIAGAITLLCTAVNGDNSPRTLAKDSPDSLAIPVTVTAVAASLCTAGSVDGVMYDPNTANNTASACLASVASAPGITILKDDGRTVSAIGDTYTYTLTATNLLVGEVLADVVLSDTLPAALEFVSASDGGSAAGNLVTWPAVTLAAAGTPSAAGGSASGAVGSSVTRTVTVRVVPAATGAIVNPASVSAPDPHDAGITLTDTTSDTDQLRKLAVAKSTSASPVGVLAGEEVLYTVTLSNVGTVDYTVGTPATLKDTLDGVLDDATFVSGSASISIDGGAAVAVSNPVSGALSWSGALAVGKSAVLTYRVLAGEGADRDLVNLAYTSPSGTSCVSGLDQNGFACATTSTPYAPTIAKTVQSLSQGDDGRWTIVYAIDVTNLNDAAAVTYGLSDALRFGAGIDADSASVSLAPVGVTPAAWSGSGAVVSGASLPAGATHHYELTVVADAGALGGTAAAVCSDGLAGGFGNLATFTPQGGDQQTSFACASPIEPTVAKSVDEPVQEADGSWTVTYTITVSAPVGAPAGGLAYTLNDEFTFPAGVYVQSASVVGPAGAPTNLGFDGASDVAVLSAADRVPASGTRVYTVVVSTLVPAGTGTDSTLACAPAGVGGYGNSVSLLSGTSAVELDSADACTRVVAEPTPVLVKKVTETSIDAASGDWTIVYELTVTNPDATLVTSYDLADELQFGDGIAVVSADVTSPDAAVSATWNGESETALVADVALPGGAVHTYTVTVVAAPPAVIDDSIAAAMDCRLDAGETGTGFRNIATLNSGVVSPSPFAVGCEAATDPSVVKTTSGAPVQNPTTGLWTVDYTVTVTNRATSTVAGGIPYTLADSFGFPAGAVVDSVAVNGPAGTTINPSFDGVNDTALATGSIGAAPDEFTPTTHVFTVSVVLSMPGGLSSAERVCDPAQGSGGLRNEVEVAVGPRITADVACATAPDSPVMGVSKSVLSQTQQADGTWLMFYRISVANPSTTVAGFYDLNDRFALGAGISLVESPTIVAQPGGVTVNHANWDGSSDSSVSSHVLLGGAGAHQYTVRAVIDAADVRSSDGAGDCVLAAEETGTGFLNAVMVSSGAADREATACGAPISPTITKAVTGAPVLGANGSWTVRYAVTVVNPSPTVGLTYGLVDELGFPTGTTFGATSVTGRTGAPAASADWDGVDETQVVPEGTTLAAGASHVFDVSVVATLPAGQQSVVDGWANTATVASSTDGVVTDGSEAKADIELPELAISKSATAPAVVKIGDTVTYTVTVDNVGVGNFTTVYPAELWDDLVGVLDDATLDAAPTVTPAGGSLVTADDRIHWSGALGAGQSADITYSVTVTAEGDQSLSNIAFGGIPGATPSTPALGDCTGDQCASTVTALPGFLLEKSASTGVVSPGDTVDYTLTFTNTGDVDVEDATFTDDLSDVLDDAVVSIEPDASSGTVDVVGSLVTWTGDLAAGESVTITYSVVVNGPLTGNGLLENVAATDPDFATRWPDGACPEDMEVCEAPEREVAILTAVRALAFTKVADATQVVPGGRLGYTVTVTNIGPADYTDESPATIVDSLGGVLDDAKYNADATAAVGRLAYAAPSLTWTGAIASGETITFRYSVTVDAKSAGNMRLDNVIGLSGSTRTPSTLAECLAAPTDNGGAHCVVSTVISPLATTGLNVGMVSVLSGILFLLLGVIFLLWRKRRELTEKS